ncbi:MAG: EamA family transporter [Cyanobacteriota bacterium]|nr:EamA family transporter [Cyanobacteriota bacterium]
MTTLEFGLFFISILTNAVGQYLLKSGALKLGTVNARDAIGYIWSVATTPELVAGLFCYGIGALAYILLLTKVNLSVAGPAIALVYVISVLLGFFAFKETIPPIRLVGLGLIVCGVILVVWRK